MAFEFLTLTFASIGEELPTELESFPIYEVDVDSYRQALNEAYRKQIDNEIIGGSSDMNIDMFEQKIYIVTWSRDYDKPIGYVFNWGTNA